MVVMHQRRKDRASPADELRGRCTVATTAEPRRERHAEHSGIWSLTRPFAAPASPRRERRRSSASPRRERRISSAEEPPSGPSGLLLLPLDVLQLIHKHLTDELEGDVGNVWLNYAWSRVVCSPMDVRGVEELLETVPCSKGVARSSKLKGKLAKPALRWCAVS